MIKAQTTFADLAALCKTGKVLFLIPCCANKCNNNGAFPLAPPHQLIDNLPPQSAQTILDGRLAALLRVRVPPLVNPNGVEFRIAPPAPDIYLQAFDRYIGHLYTVPGIHGLLAQPNNCIAIISALFGLIAPSDYIQDYDLEMSRVQTIWSPTLPFAIDAYATVRNADVIVGLFGRTTAYMRLFRRLARVPSRSPVYGVFPINVDAPAMRNVPAALGQALLCLANGIQPPAGHDYAVDRIR